MQNISFENRYMLDKVLNLHFKFEKLVLICEHFPLYTKLEYVFKLSNGRISNFK